MKQRTLKACRAFRTCATMMQPCVMMSIMYIGNDAIYCKPKVVRGTQLENVRADIEEKHKQMYVVCKCQTDYCFGK